MKWEIFVWSVEDQTKKDMPLIDAKRIAENRSKTINEMVEYMAVSKNRCFQYIVDLKSESVRGMIIADKKITQDEAQRLTDLKQQGKA